MNRKIAIMIALGAIATAFPLDVFAQTTNDFGSADILMEAEKTYSFLWRVVLYCMAIVGGAYALVQVIMSSNPKPLIVFVGTGIAATIIPKFIYGVYGVSGAMLP